MASNRIYPAQVCINPDCGEEFYPHDRRQVFCCRQCRINYYNDQRRIENAERFGLEEVMRSADKVLEVLLDSNFFQDELISEETLQAFAIPMNIGTLEENLLTRRPIRWYHAYGLELVDKTGRLFTIHYRTNL